MASRPRTLRHGEGTAPGGSAVSAMSADVGECRRRGRPRPSPRSRPRGRSTRSRSRAFASPVVRPRVSSEFRLDETASSSACRSSDSDRAPHGVLTARSSSPCAEPGKEQRSYRLPPDLVPSTSGAKCDVEQSRVPRSDRCRPSTCGSPWTTTRSFSSFRLDQSASWSATAASTRPAPPRRPLPRRHDRVRDRPATTPAWPRRRNRLSAGAAGSAAGSTRQPRRTTSAHSIARALTCPRRGAGGWPCRGRHPAAAAAGAVRLRQTPTHRDGATSRSAGWFWALSRGSFTSTQTIAARRHERCPGAGRTGHPGELLDTEEAVGDRLEAVGEAARSRPSSRRSATLRRSAPMPPRTES